MVHSAKGPAPTPISWRQATAFRLRRHRLDARAPSGELVAVAGAMGGAQAQLLSAAAVSLWTRVVGLGPFQVRDALRQRSLVKMWCMRRTLYLVPASDVAMYGRGTARRVLREIRWARGKGVSAAALERALTATLAALDAPATRREIADSVAGELGVPVREKTGGGGWGNDARSAWLRVGKLLLPVGYLLHLAASRGVYCHGPPRGNEPTFVRAEAWVSGWKDLPGEAAERELLRRYLAAFGPATPADFAWWTGMLRSEAERLWAGLGSEIAPVSLESRTAGILVKDLPALLDRDEPVFPARLLPYFDSFLLGHGDRGRLVPPRHYGKVYRPQGWVSPVVLIDGQVAGVWAHARRGGRLAVSVTGFGGPVRRARRDLAAEAHDLARFLGADRSALSLGSPR